MNSKAQTTRLFRRASTPRRAWRKILEIVLGRLPVGRWLRSIGPFRSFYTRQVMARMDHTGLHSGLYGSYEEARRAIPSARLSGWDHEETAGLWVGNIDPVRLSTYPIFFWLGKLLTGGLTLVDAGGSIGLTYYGFRRLNGIPADIRWVVVEFPKIVEQGRKIAQEQKAPGLLFVESMTEVSHCDILLTAGSLQFMSTTIVELLTSLPNLPSHVLINKLPVSAQEEAFTLQNYGPAVSPMRLFNEDKLLGDLRGLGYELRDRWGVDDLDCLIPLYPERFVRAFSGFYFVRIDP